MWLKFVYSVIRPMLVDWIHGRALRIPENQLQALAAKYKISVDVVRAMENEVAIAVVTQLDNQVYNKVLPF
jgi:hypothetical protein